MPQLDVSAYPNFLFVFAISFVVIFGFLIRFYLPAYLVIRVARVYFVDEMNFLIDELIKRKALEMESGSFARASIFGLPSRADSKSLELNSHLIEPWPVLLGSLLMPTPNEEFLIAFAFFLVWYLIAIDFNFIVRFPQRLRFDFLDIDVRTVPVAPHNFVARTVSLYTDRVLKPYLKIL